MANVVITNLTSDTVLLQELYTDIKPNKSISFEREIDQLHAMPELQKLWHDGIINVSITETNSEEQFINEKLHSKLSLKDTTRAFHQPIISATAGSNAPGQQPTIIPIGSVLTAVYDIGVNKGYRLYKIPINYSDSPAFHVHWTKSSNVNENTKSVKWRLQYTVFSGINQDVNVSPSTISLDDTYDDAGTTSRIVYRTLDVAVTGFVAGYYVGISIEAVAPDGVALASSPALVSVDMTFNEFINK